MLTGETEKKQSREERGKNSQRSYKYRREGHA